MWSDILSINVSRRVKRKMSHCVNECEVTLFMVIVKC